MATVDPRSDPVTFLKVTNKLQIKMNAFREVIEEKMLEIRKVSKEMRCLIERKEEAMIQELEAIWKELNTRIEITKAETQEMVREIERKGREIEKLFQDLHTKPKHISQLSESIDSVGREIDIEIPNVKLTWRVNQLEDCINRMCRCEQQILAFNEDTRFQLKWSNFKRGSGENQLFGPCGIAINPMDENIYVADYDNHRIQIFSKEGEWVRSVKDDEIESPENILFHNKSIYIQCYRAILKLNQSTEKKEKSKSYDFTLGGVCTDGAHIYVGEYNGMNLIELTLDLIEKKRIFLTTEFCRQATEIRDISISRELFYILLSETEFPFQIFSRNGILASCFIKKDSIKDAYHFCRDQHYNILVADFGDSEVKIFSNEGKLLTQFGEKGSKKGQFTDLVGISVDELGSIVTVDQKKSHRLQLFYIL